MPPFLKQQVLFILGKGGVGRTTLSAALAYHCAHACKENVLIIQWSLDDAISPLFGAPAAGHKHQSVLPGLSVMNYDADEAMKEYFVDHLDMGFFYHMVLENRQVQKLIHAAPGLEELFFLGRLFWVVELAEKERGYRFDRILVDAPATGHGSALFGVASTISRFKLSGPLVSEAARVARLLEDQEKVGTVLVTLPEELPIEETLETIPRLLADTGRAPLAIFLNRSLRPLLQNPVSANGTHLPPGLENLGQDCRATALALYENLFQRLEYEETLHQATQIPILSLPDLMISHPDRTNTERIALLSEYLFQ